MLDDKIHYCHSYQIMQAVCGKRMCMWTNKIDTITCEECLLKANMLLLAEVGLGKISNR